MADVTLTYKGATIGELSESGNKTIKTAGKYCEADILLEYEKPQGGFDGFEVVTNANNDVTGYIFHGLNVPNLAADTLQYNRANNYPSLSFADKPTNIGTRAFYNAKLVPDFTNLSEVKTAGQQSFCFNSGMGTTLQTVIVDLPEFTGLDASGVLPGNIFSVRNTKYYFRSFILPKMVNIPTGAWYGCTMDNIDITIGSIGNGVIQSGVQPFDATSSANGTVTVFITGEKLTSLKSVIERGKGSNLNFIYKASEATTYNGTAYNAGDTITT